MPVNDKIYAYNYYKELTVLDMDDLLLFPVSNKHTIDKILDRVNTTVGSKSEAIENKDLLLTKPDNYLNPIESTLGTLLGDVYGSTGYVSDLYKFIPMRVTIRDYNNTYHLQIKDEDIVLTNDQFLFLFNDDLTIKFDYVEENDILANPDKFMRRGDYFDLIVTADRLLGIGLDIDKITKLSIDTSNYKYILFSIPDMLTNAIVSHIGPERHIGAIDTYKDTWISHTLIDKILKADINEIDSHVVRKFVTDIQRENYAIDEDSNLYSNVKLIKEYINRNWTDDIRFFIEKSFKETLSSLGNMIFDFRRVVCIIKKDNDIHPDVPDSIPYSEDKNYILKHIRDMAS